MTKDEALKLALEALEARGVSMFTDDTVVEDAITALRQALAEQPAQQEPVAWRSWNDHDGYGFWETKQEAEPWCAPDFFAEPLYTSPQPAQQEFVSPGGGYVPAIPAQQALDKMAENARELGLDYEPAQKPVAYLCENAVGHQYFRWKKPSSTYKPIALYTSPPAQRTWVGLTDEDIEIAFDDTQEGGGFDDFARAIEAKLKEKNT